MLCYNSETTTGKRSSIYPGSVTLQSSGSSPIVVSNSTDRSELHCFLGIPDAVLKLAHLLKPVQEKGRCAVGEMYPQRDLKSEMMLFILQVKSRRQQAPPTPVSWTRSRGLPVQLTRSAANDLKALRKWQWCVPVVTGLVFASVCACAGVCMGGALWI